MAYTSAELRFVGGGPRTRGASSRCTGGILGKRGDLLSGEWTSSWGKATIAVDDGKLTGTWAEGGLTGTVADDGTVAIDWSHEDGTTGKASLSASDGDDALKGTWGFGDSDTDGGDWEMTQTKRDAPPPAEEPTVDDSDGAAAKKKPAAKKPAAKKKAAKKPAAKSSGK